MAERDDPRGRTAWVAAGRPLVAEDLRELETRAEATTHLAALSWNDPESVYVIGCAREIEIGGFLGSYLVHAAEERTLARPAAQVSLVVAAGVSCAEALLRLDHIRGHLEELPSNTILATDDSGSDRLTDRLARLHGACDLVLAEMTEEIA
jgi:hypothetical protein